MSRLCVAAPPSDRLWAPPLSLYRRLFTLFTNFFLALQLCLLYLCQQTYPVLPGSWVSGHKPQLKCITNTSCIFAVGPLHLGPLFCDSAASYSCTFVIHLSPPFLHLCSRASLIGHYHQLCGFLLPYLCWPLLSCFSAVGSLLVNHIIQPYFSFPPLSFCFFIISFHFLASTSFILSVL